MTVTSQVRATVLPAREWVWRVLSIVGTDAHCDLDERPQALPQS